MRNTFLILLAALLVLTSDANAKQTETETELAVRSLGRLRATHERRALFLNAWEQASAGEQARAIRILRLEREGATRLTATPSARELTRAWSTLTRSEEDPFEPSSLRLLADSLDLRVLPGAFEGKPEGKPDHLTVRVTALYQEPIDHPLQVSLYWIHEDGREIRARTEVVAHRALSAIGFEMYVRAPTNLPETWSLVPEVSDGEESARGVPVTVMGLDQPEVLVREGDEGTAKDLKLLRLYGIRPLFLRAFQENLGVLSVDDQEAWRGARPVESALEPFSLLRAAGVSCWAVGVEGVDSPRKVLILMRPEDERPETALAGAQGRVWSEAARSNGWWVLAPDLPLHSPEGPSILSIASRLSKLLPDAERILVGRGSALVELQLAQLHDLDWSVDRLVLSVVLSPSGRPRNLPALPGLFLSSNALETGSESLDLHAQEMWLWEKRVEPPIITDLGLPLRLERWLSAED